MVPFSIIVWTQTPNGTLLEDGRPVSIALFIHIVVKLSINKYKTRQISEELQILCSEKHNIVYLVKSLLLERNTKQYIYIPIMYTKNNL